MTKVGKYELVRKLATGGMAEVFLARFEWARGLEKTVVVKRILYHLAEDPSFIEMFFTEAQLAAQLSHPNIAQIIEFGESEGVYFLAMEYIDGPSLRALTSAAQAAGTGIPLPHCARIAAFCCEALTHAHELVDSATGTPLNLVHRDVSPDNILLSKSGSVKLVDFGIAKAATNNHQTKTGLVKGKLAYMSPEQLRAEPLDRRADVFSLGVVLYELVAGAKPYDAASEITLIHAMLYENLVPLKNRRKDVPPELERIVYKALERNRDLRYADCRAMHADLEDYLIAMRQPVSALQIAQLVEKHQHPPGKVEGTPPRPLATPSRPIQTARTPEPFRAERTPAVGATAKILQPQLRTGTDGDSGGAPAPLPEAVSLAPLPSVEKTELIPSPRPPKPSAPLPPQASPVQLTNEELKSAKKSRAPIALASVAAVVLLASALALIRPFRTERKEQPERTAPAELPKAAEQGKDPGPKAIAVVAQPENPPPTPETHRDTPPPPTPPPPPKKQAPPMVELEVRSDPPAMIELFMGGKPRGSHQSPLAVRLPPGQVDIKVTGSKEQGFVKHDSVTLEAGSKKKEHVVTVGQGTVMIRSFPASHVTVDGTARGDVPLKLTLYEGQHTVHFECDRSVPKCASGAQADKTVTVQPGKSAEILQRWP